MAFDFRNISSYELRQELFDDSDIASRIDKVAAKRLASKSKDCLKQIEAASSVWSMDGRKFLFIFSEINEEGLQKATVWGLKSPGLYQRIKTVWVSCKDYLFEALPRFLTEYFELNLNPERYRCDAEWFYDIEDELKFLSDNCPPSLKPKLKLLRIWSDAMHRFNEMVSELDLKILNKVYEDSEDDVQSSFPSMSESADTIYSEIDFSREMDIDLMGAAQMYQLAKIIESREKKDYAKVIEAGVPLQSNAKELINRLNRGDFKGTDRLNVLNIIVCDGIYAKITHFDQLEKWIGKYLRLQLETSMDEKEPLSFELLEQMVYTRQFNKRLPKELSDHLKEILNYKVSSIGNFWEKIPECGSLAGKLWKLWIQCMSLRLYNYNPNTSYTADELRQLMPLIISSTDPEVLLLFARIIYDADFNRIRIDNYDEVIAHSISPKASKAELLKRQATLLLWKAFELKHPASPEADNPVNIEVKPSTKSSPSSQPIRKLFQSREEVREWMEHMDHYESLRGKGVSLRDFCLVKDLPYDEFKQFYEETMADYEFCATSPFMKAITKIPEDEQKEMASVFDSHMLKIDEICKGISKLSGKKFEVSDYLADREKIEGEFTKNIDAYRKKDIVETMKVVFNMDQIRKLESDMRDIIRRNGLEEHSL